MSTKRVSIRRNRASQFLTSLNNFNFHVPKENFNTSNKLKIPNQNKSFREDADILGNIVSSKQNGLSNLSSNTIPFQLTKPDTFHETRDKSAKEASVVHTKRGIKGEIKYYTDVKQQPEWTVVANKDSLDSLMEDGDFRDRMQNKITDERKFQTNRFRRVLTEPARNFRLNDLKLQDRDFRMLTQRKSDGDGGYFRFM